MQHLMTKAAFAERAGVSKPAVSKQCREGGRLFAALVNGKIDAGHPDAQVYLVNRGVNQKLDAPDVPKHRPLRGLPDDGSPDAMVEIQKLTLGELTERMGGNAELAEWLKTLKTNEEVRTARLKNDELQGSYHPSGPCCQACIRRHGRSLSAPPFRRGPHNYAPASREC